MDLGVTTPRCAAEPRTTVNNMKRSAEGAARGGPDVRKRGRVQKKAGYAMKTMDGSQLLKRKEFRLASWNLQGGLSDGHSLALVERDLATRKISVACLQETHRPDGLSRETPGYGWLICLEEPDGTPEAPPYGLGFYVAEELMSTYVGHKRVSNRIAVLRLRRPSSGKRSACTISIINAYGPTAQRTEKEFGRAEQSQFFRQLQEIYTECKRHSAIVLVAGDFNAKLGLRRVDARSGVAEAFMGKFGKGTRNANGERLAAFLESTHLYAANTRFQHPMRHRSTWSGCIRRNGDTRLYFNQIDYILVDQRQRRSLRNARAYNGQVFNSDHSMVVATFHTVTLFTTLAKENWLRVGGSGAAMPPEVDKLQDGIGRRVDVSVLAIDQDTTTNYKTAVSNLVRSATDKIHANTDKNTVEDYAKILTSCVEEAATEALPERQVRYNGKVNYTQDARLRKLSTQQKQLREKIRGRRGGTRSQTESAKKKRRTVMKAIKKRVRELREESIKRLATEMEATPEARRKFEVARTLRRKATQSFQLKDPDGYMTQAPLRLLEMTRAHFKDFFNPPGHESVSLWGEYGKVPLAVEIHPEEVRVAVRRLRNGRAVGPDGIPGELLKYGGEDLADGLAQVFNRIFREQAYLPELGAGYLIPLNKPGKECTLKNVRPITLLNTIRKVLSLVALGRIEADVQRFVGQAQCGFRRGRSTLDVTWAYSWLKATAWRYQRTIHVAGIDMSKAFDTVLRGPMLGWLEEITNPSACRIVRVLLAQTTLRIVNRGYVSAEFNTAIGTPQGDGLSPILFIIYLEGCQRKVRALDQGLYGQGPLRRWGRQVTEMLYADDVDFIATSREVLTELVEVVTEHFRPFNLQVNVDKTEHKTIHAGVTELSKYKKLGTQLDADADVGHRIHMAEVAFHSMWAIWKRELRTVSVDTRLRLYNACVKSVLLYNVAATPFTEVRMRKMETTHRRHLRRLLKIFWPEVVTNDALYKRAGSTSIRQDIWERKLSYLRRALLHDRNTPARESMEQYFRHLEDAPKIRGRPTTIVKELDDVLKLVGRRLQSWGDLEVLRAVAYGPSGGWKELCKEIISRVMERAQAAEAMRRDRRHEVAARKRCLQPANENPVSQPGKRRRRSDSVSGATQPEQSAESDKDECVIRHAGMVIRLTVGRKRNAPEDEQPLTCVRLQRMRLVVADHFVDICYWRRPMTPLIPAPTPVHGVQPTQHRIRPRRSARQRRAFEREQVDNRPSGLVHRTIRHEHRTEAANWGVHGRDF